MISNKDLALHKMLEEMKNNKSASIDVIHNFLCDQENEEVFRNILKEGKTIKKSYEYVTEKARKQANGSSAMVPREVVFKWVLEYFEKDDAELSEEVTKKSKKPVEKKVEDTKAKEVSQISLFD